MRNLSLLFLSSMALCMLAGNAADASLGVGARALGMGGAFIALADDETTIYWNPSMLDYADKNFSMSVPAVGIAFSSNKSRNEIDSLEGDEIGALGNLNLALGVSGMAGFHVGRVGVGAILDVEGDVAFIGSNLDKVQSLIDTINNSAAGNYDADLSALGIAPGDIVSMDLSSEFIATARGVVSYAMKQGRYDLGVSVKSLKGQVYYLSAGYFLTVPSSPAPLTPACNGCYLIDADGNGVAFDVAVTRPFKNISSLYDTRAALVVRDIFGHVKVSGTKTVVDFVDTDPGPDVRYELQEQTGAAAGDYSATVNLAPEIAVGFAGKSPSGFTVAADFELDTDDGAAGLRFGVEKKLGILDLRAGWGSNTVTRDVGYSLGLGLDLKILILDLAYGGAPGRGENQTLAGSLRLAF